MSYLTPQQFQVIEALSNGATMTDAAAQAGIHRNTIVNWRRGSPDFREELAHAHYDRAALHRERAVDLADLAFEAIRTVLTDPSSSPSTRLRAAIFIIDKASTPPKFEKEKPASMADLFAAVAEAGHAHFAQQAAEPPAGAQNCTTVPSAPEAEVQPGPILHMHNSAQPLETYRRPEPKIGRNDMCPCGTGKKYKHCCLGKSASAGAA